MCSYAAQWDHPFSYAERVRRYEANGTGLRRRPMVLTDLAGDASFLLCADVVVTFADINE